MDRPLCRCCQKKPACRARGLCWTCYQSPANKELFPSTSKFARKGLGGDNVVERLPEHATDIPPGPGKVELLSERASRGEMLFHPGDNLQRVWESSPPEEIEEDEE